VTSDRVTTGYGDVKRPEAVPFFPTVRAGLSMLAADDRRKAIWLSLLIGVTELLQLISILLVLPVVGVVVKPGMLKTSEKVAALYAWIGSPPLDQFIIVMASGALIFLLVGQIGAFLVNRYVEMFAAGLNTRLSRDLLLACVTAPYTWFLGRNPTELTRLMHNDITLWGRDFIGSFLRLFSYALTTVSTTLLVVFIAPVIGVAMLGIASFFAIAAFFLLKSHQLDANARAKQASQTSMAIASQSLNGMKDVKANDTGSYFVGLFRSAQEMRYRQSARAKVHAQLPTMAIMLAMQSGLLIFLIGLWISNVEGGAVAAYMALIVLASARITPAVVRLQTAMAKINAALPWVAGLCELRDVTLSTREERRENLASGAEPADWSVIAFDHVSFRYPDAQRTALTGISCRFDRGQCYGIIGASGAGKSTFVDLFLGLLEPQDGAVTVDALNLRGISHRWWLAQIGYVPQHPYFTDDTLAANIAFGVPEAEIDRDRVANAAELAGIAELASERAEGYAMPMGDRGGRVSGGQRQRIAIARALYRNPSVLVLDEPTASLDPENEQLIVDTLIGLKGKVTILVITHRDTTLRACDEVIRLEGGRIVAPLGDGVAASVGAG
jgi:ABC-type multidrug transport system fused ATPase/permease subunit